MKLKPIHKIGMLAVLLFAAALLFIQAALIPMLSGAGKTSSEINKLKLQIKKEELDLKSRASRAKKIVLYPRQEQLSKIVEFTDRKFKEYGIKLISMNQTSAENQLSIKVDFNTTDDKLIAFLKSLPELNTLLIIDSISINQKGEGILVTMWMRSGYL